MWLTTVFLRQRLKRMTMVCIGATAIIERNRERERERERESGHFSSLLFIPYVVFPFLFFLVPLSLFFSSVFPLLFLSFSFFSLLFSFFPFLFFSFSLCFLSPILLVKGVFIRGRGEGATLPLSNHGEGVRWLGRPLCSCSQGLSPRPLSS